MYPDGRHDGDGRNGLWRKRWKNRWGSKRTGDKHRGYRQHGGWEHCGGWGRGWGSRKRGGYQRWCRRGRSSYRNPEGSGSGDGLWGRYVERGLRRFWEQSWGSYHRAYRGQEAGGCDHSWDEVRGLSRCDPACGWRRVRFDRDLCEG